MPEKAHVVLEMKIQFLGLEDVMKIGNVRTGGDVAMD
jgi:hypothetical protein